VVERLLAERPVAQDAVSDPGEKRDERGRWTKGAYVEVRRPKDPKKRWLVQLHGPPDERGMLSGQRVNIGGEPIETPAKGSPITFTSSSLQTSPAA
jgi:hypothetical protein